MEQLLLENDYLRRRVMELERENQHIRLMLAAKTLVIEKIQFKFENITIDHLSGSLQIGLTHAAEAVNQPLHLPSLQQSPTFRI